MSSSSFFFVQKADEPVTRYQVVHGPGQLLGHLQLPGDVHTALLLLQVGVERTKFPVLLHHHV